MAPVDEPPLAGPMRASSRVTGLPRKDGRATASLALGAVSLVAWLLPIVGLPVAVTGLVLGRKSRAARPGPSAAAGVVTSAIGIFLSVANAAFGTYLALNA